MTQRVKGAQFFKHLW